MTSYSSPDALERGDDARAQHRLERTPHRLQRHSEIGGLVAVDLDDHAWLALQIVGLEIEDAGIFRRDAIHDLVAPLHDFGVVTAAECDRERPRAVARERAAGLVHVDARAGDVLGALAQTVRDEAGAVVALVPEIERERNEAGVGLGGAAETACSHDHALRVAALYLVPGDLLHLAQLAIEVRQLAPSGAPTKIRTNARSSSGASSLGSFMPANGKP